MIVSCATPLEQFSIYTSLPIHFGPFYLSFTNSSLFMTATVILAFLLFSMVTEKGAFLIPSRWQSIVEMIYEFVVTLVKEQIGGRVKKHLTLIFTLIFVYLFFNNIRALIFYSSSGFTLFFSIFSLFSLLKKGRIIVLTLSRIPILSLRRTKQKDSCFALRREAAVLAKTKKTPAAVATQAAKPCGKTAQIVLSGGRSIKKKYLFLLPGVLSLCLRGLLEGSPYSFIVKGMLAFTTVGAVNPASSSDSISHSPSASIDSMEIDPPEVDPNARLMVLANLFIANEQGADTLNQEVMLQELFTVCEVARQGGEEALTQEFRSQAFLTVCATAPLPEPSASAYDADTEPSVSASNADAELSVSASNDVSNYAPANDGSVSESASSEPASSTD